MAISWGPARTTGTNGARVGIELFYTRSGNTATVHAELWLWTMRASGGTDASYSRGGSFGSGSGSFGYSHTNNSSDWPSANRTRIGTWTTSRTLGSSSQSVSFSGSVSGLYGNMPSGSFTHSRSITLPSTGPSVPDPPTGAYIYPQSNYTQARLEWQNNSVSGRPWSGIHVERRHRLSAGGSFSPWTRRANLNGQATFRTEDVTGNWHYHYRVRAWNSAGNSDWLDMGRLNTTPATPSSVTATRLSTGMRVNWSRNNLRIPYAEVRTVIERSMNGGAWTEVVSLSGAPTTWTHSGAGQSASHRYRVRIENTDWGSATSGWGTSNTVYAAPPAPSNVTASRSSDERTNVTWTRNPSAGGPYSSQQVQRRHLQANGSWSSWTTRATVSGTATSYTDSHGENNRLQYRVRASSGDAWGSFGTSNQIDTTPWAPSGVQAQPTATGIRLVWANRAPFPTSTRVERREDGGAWIHAITRGNNWDEWTLEDPDLAVTHQFRVRSEGQGTPSLNSAWVTSNVVELASPPSAPTGLGPSSPWDATEDRGFTWRHTSTDGSGQERYQVRHRLAGETAWTTEAEAVSGVERWVLPAETYANGDSIEWQVRTWGVHPTGSPWSVTDLTTPQARPTVAINTPADGEPVERSDVEVTWGYADEQDADQVAWRITLLDELGDPVQEHSGTGDISTFRLTGLEDEATYTLQLEVRSSTGLWSVPDESTFPVSYAPPPRPEVTVTWDVDQGAAVVELTYPDDETEVELSHAQLWRAIGEGPWLLIADEVPIDTVIIDPIPAIGDGTVNHYKARAVSVLPSTVDSEPVQLVVPSTGRGGTGGWVYLNGGPGMDTVCRVRANATRSGTRGRARTLRQFAGRTRPVAFSGTARSNEWDVAARVAPNYDGASTDDELVDLQDEHGNLVCYRDPTGKRWYGAMGPVGDSVRSIIGEVSFSMAEVDHVEGLAVERRATVPDEEPEVPDLPQDEDPEGWE